MKPVGPGYFAGLTRARMAGLLFLVAIGIVVVSLALLGLPGAAWLTIATPVARVFTSSRAPADSAWPMALLHSMLWPLFLPLAYLIAARVTSPGRARTVWTIVVTAAVAFALAVAFQAGSGVL